MPIQRSALRGEEGRRWTYTVELGSFVKFDSLSNALSGFGGSDADALASASAFDKTDTINGNSGWLDFGMLA